MKILKRGSKSSQKFKVIRNNFCLPGGHQPEINEELEFIGPEQLADALALIQKGSLIPVDLPVVGKYLAIISFELPGAIKKHEAKSNEIVELKAEDALGLMLARKVVPVDKSQWSPYRIKEKRQLSSKEQYLQELAKSWRKE